VRTLAVVLAWALASSTSVWTAGPPWMTLRTRGVVVQNSVPARDGATARPGDRITTDADGLAILTSPEIGRAEVRGDSDARLGAARIELERGAVAASRLPVFTGGFVLSPQGGGNAWYAVARRDGRLLVVAHRGAVVIDTAGAPAVVVPEGHYAEKTASVDEPERPPAESKETKRQKRRRGAAAAGTASSGGWTIGSLSHAASVALIVGVGAGVAVTTAAIARSVSESGPSPD